MLKKILLFFLIFLIRNLGYAQVIIVSEEPKSKLTILKKDNKFQLINETGETILSNLDSACYYEKSDLFLVRKKGAWGMTSIYGKVVIPIEYDKIERSYNQFWEVTKNKKKGIYDVYKGLVLPVEFDLIQFSWKVGEEYIVKKGIKLGIFNDKGEEVVPLVYDEIENNSGTLVLKEKDRASYFIGKKVISDTLILNKTFEIYGTYPSDTKTYYVLFKNGRYGVIDSKNNLIIGPKYQDILYRRILKANNKDDYFLLVQLNSLWGMIDIKENQIIPLQYQNIEIINQDFAIVKINGYKYFYNFRTKKLIDDFNFESFYMFSSEYSRIRKEGKETLVDNKQQFKLVFPFMYENVLVCGKWFVVEQNSKYGIVDKNNQIIIPIQYEEVSISCDKVIAKKDGKYGILSLENKLLIPFEYPGIIGYDERIEILQINNSRIRIYDCNLKCIENCN